MNAWTQLAISAGVSLGVAVALLFVIWLSVQMVSRRITWLKPAYDEIRPRMRALIIVVALLMGVLSAQQDDALWWAATIQALIILSILAAGFLLQKIVNYIVSQFITRFEEGDQSDAETRRITTQLRILRRLANAIIGLFTVGLALFTFPEVQAVGAGLLASAGIVSVIGGLAAQAVLGNLFAGVQLAFSNAIRVGDVVVVEGEWGTIGEITLSYVVVYIWDERRLIVPSTYFTSTPFETWTRNSPKVYGIVTMDVDWSVPVEKVREEFHRYLETTDLWDKRVASCQLTDSSGGYIQVRFVASAEDSSKQWNLRCDIREHMVSWVQTHHPDALPRMRVTVSDKAPTTKRSSK